MSSVVKSPNVGIIRPRPTLTSTGPLGDGFWAKTGAADRPARVNGIRSRTIWRIAAPHPEMRKRPAGGLRLATMAELRERPESTHLDRHRRGGRVPRAP